MPINEDHRRYRWRRINNNGFLAALAKHIVDITLRLWKLATVSLSNEYSRS